MRWHSDVSLARLYCLQSYLVYNIYPEFYLVQKPQPLGGVVYAACWSMVTKCCLHQCVGTWWPLLAFSFCLDVSKCTYHVSVSCQHQHVAERAISGGGSCPSSIPCYRLWSNALITLTYQRPSEMNAFTSQQISAAVTFTGMYTYVWQKCANEDRNLAFAECCWTVLCYRDIACQPVCICSLLSHDKVPNYSSVLLLSVLYKLLFHRIWLHGMKRLHNRYTAL